MRHISSAKKNAKVAGINKLIQFSKCEIDWLDTKFDENSVDCVVSKAPCVSNNLAEVKVIKIYREMIYQFEYILAKKGKIVLAFTNSELFEKFLENTKLKLKEKRKIWQGQQKFDVLVIERI